ncbi:uncharacterized protein [Panulirus ornatus]|uniref:uncharacterized protein n=1 Tax=Panulirus ornatus TaxID=150431 RepID=UPI003A872EB8
MFSIDKGNSETVWNSDAPYTHLSHKLPPLLPASQVVVNTSINTALVAMYPGTRLQLLGGSVPYIPCQVRQYNATDAGRCTTARAVEGRKTWIAFVGDSNQRQKTHSFLDFLPSDLMYTYYLGNKKVTLEDFTYAVAHHKHRPPTFDVIGRRPTRRTTWRHSPETSDDSHGDAGGPSPDEALSDGDHDAYNKQEDRDKANSSTKEHNPDSKLDQQLSAAQDDNGRVLSDNNDGHPTESSDESLLEEDISWENIEVRVTLVWAPAASVREPNFVESNTNQPRVTQLEEWVVAEVIPDVIVLGFGTWMLLMRQYHDELAPFTELDNLVQPLVKPLTLLASRTHLLVWSQSRYRWFNFEGEVAPVETEYKEFWKQTLYLNQFRDAIPTLDTWLWRILGSTGAWRWDSTLPFNLANIQECLLLKDAMLWDNPIYTGTWWNCADVHHSSYETNSVEIQMLLNLLCNSYLADDREYCCSGK